MFRVRFILSAPPSLVAQCSRQRRKVCAMLATQAGNMGSRVGAVFSVASTGATLGPRLKRACMRAS